ncbi:Uu.00g138980.m01.CDS01 [Anthostomella pinea]|uniref:Uu.00g138980.m01.CDS01 n=1 Tax=Anthostomella pinea TaxID=933095 RepID=A0AAI8VPV0_9PEZI|nr:Uu.00g138980.m01.CDS01 [Anthostomella pinea]
MVLALVQSHSLRANPGAKYIQDSLEIDLVHGKGRGTIILLQGPPGVGKTSTAECVASHTGRPLFPITCGDLGSSAKEVEESLRSSFDLAHKWGAVLLLDEADVFLMERNKAELERNGVVSVFLRVLEYYPGILLLTTNRRQGDIDDYLLQTQAGRDDAFLAEEAKLRYDHYQPTNMNAHYQSDPYYNHTPRDHPRSSRDQRTGIEGSLPYQSLPSPQLQAPLCASPQTQQRGLNQLSPRSHEQQPHGIDHDVPTTPRQHMHSVGNWTASTRDHGEQRETHG